MQSGRHILLDFLLYFIVYGNLLAVYNFLHALTVFVLAGNLSGNLNSLEVILLSYCHCDQALSDLADLLCTGLGCLDMAMV